MLQSLIGPVSDLLDKWIVDADTKAQLAHEIATMSERHAHQIALAQIEVNKEAAKTGGIFRAGWRPAVGWVCAIAFAWYFVLQPVTLFVLLTAGLPVPPLPEFDVGALFTVLGGLLGLGGLRTFEKTKGLK